MSNQPSLSALLTAFQQRAIRVAFLRHLITAGALALLAAATVVVLLRPSGRMQLLLVLAALLIALVSAALAAWRTRPRLRATAAAIDRRCRLDDCVATAVQFDSGDDQLSDLVAAQARAHLAHITPAQAFPLEWPAHPRVLTALVAIAVVILAGARVGALPEWSGVRISGGAASSAAADGTEVPRLAADSQGSTAAAPSAGSPASDPRSVPRSPESRSESADADFGAGAKQIVAAAPSGHTSDTDAPTAVPDREDSVTDRAGQGSAPAAAARATRSEGMATNAVPGGNRVSAGGSGPGAGRSSGQTSGRAGGVRSGQLQQGGAVASRGEIPADYAIRYRDAAAAAEEAMVREQVPAELRSAIRAYFSAIRP